MWICKIIENLLWGLNEISVESIVRESRKVILVICVFRGSVKVFGIVIIGFIS